VTIDTTSNNAECEHDPEQLRAALVADIRRRGIFQTPQVEEAFSRVPRHLFLPGVSLTDAYAQQVVVTKQDEDGSALSSASKPSIVAMMLEQLDVRPGDNVLEIGAATGINAALLAELAGPSGSVTTIEIDQELAEGARAALAGAAYDTVTAVCGDGADGYPVAAPYDRIIVTAGAWDISTAWWDQLAVGGRIVVPLVLHGSGLTRSIAFHKTSTDRMVSDSVRVCGFIGMRGTLADTTSRRIVITEDLTLQLDTRLDVDEAALRDAFATDAVQDTHWTGLLIDHAQRTEHLDLWLATTIATAEVAYARLLAGRVARDTGTANPTLRWGGAALHDARTGTTTYLTLRDHDDHTEKIGIVTCGADIAARQSLTERTRALLARWDAERPIEPAVTAITAGAPGQRLPDGYRVDKPDTRLIITW